MTTQEERWNYLVKMANRGLIEWDEAEATMRAEFPDWTPPTDGE